MNTRTVRCILAAAAILAVPTVDADNSKETASAWQEEFGIKNCNLQTTGRNPYFILEPGHQLVLEGAIRSSRSLCSMTPAKSTESCVVEEKEWKDGKLYEIARNYFAICAQTKDVFYFGEDVDFYENGKVVKHVFAGSTTTWAGYDLTFRTYADDAIAQVPEPGSLGLLAIGIAGLGGALRKKASSKRAA
jgi:hypothetical protein